MSSETSRPSRSSTTFASLIAFCLAAAVNAGCACQSNVHSGCTVDDDCRGTVCPAGQLPACMSNACGCGNDTPIGDIGRFSSMAMRGPTAYVAAYNTTYGDLMIGDISPPGVVTNWTFVDGVPETSSSDNPLSQVRGGITDPGDDVGKYTSLAIDKSGDPIVAYYDATHGALKFASFGAVRWHAHVVDHGTGLPKAGGDNIGKWASLTFAKDGSPGIAYYAEVAKGASGMRESQLRFAQAKRPNPQAPSDWFLTTILSVPMPVLDPMAPPPAIPDGVALFIASARKGNGSPVITYYDNSPAGPKLGPQGNLMYVEYDPAVKKFNTPMVLDGAGMDGSDTGDVGQYPSIVMGSDDTAHISYVDATHDNLLYVNTKTKTPEVVDDGYRPKDEMTLDGLPAPVYHLVGDSSSIQLSGESVLIAYQDSTVEQLRFAARDPMKGTWALSIVAGHATPFKGSYGFYAQNRVQGSQAVLSSYAINQHLDSPSFYVEVFGVTLSQIIQ